MAIWKLESHVPGKRGRWEPIPARALTAYPQCHCRPCRCRHRVLHTGDRSSFFKERGTGSGGIPQLPPEGRWEALGFKMKWRCLAFSFQIGLLSEQKNVHSKNFKILASTFSRLQGGLVSKLCPTLCSPVHGLYSSCGGKLQPAPAAQAPAGGTRRPVPLS